MIGSCNFVPRLPIYWPKIGTGQNYYNKIGVKMYGQTCPIVQKLTPPGTVRRIRAMSPFILKHMGKVIRLKNDKKTIVWLENRCINA